jgi:hypothetical protein
MAARYPIRLAPLPLSDTHRSQNANANSLAGGSAYSHRPLVLKGQNVPNIVCVGWQPLMSGLSQLWKAKEGF